MKDIFLSLKKPGEASQTPELEFGPSFSDGSYSFGSQIYDSILSANSVQCVLEYLRTPVFEKSKAKFSQKSYTDNLSPVRVFETDNFCWTKIVKT